MRDAEIAHARKLAGLLEPMLDELAANLHHNESLHLHAAVQQATDCGYCYLRAGRALGLMARRFDGEPVLFRKRDPDQQTTTFHGPLTPLSATIKAGDVLTLTIEGVDASTERFGGTVRYTDA